MLYISNPNSHAVNNLIRCPFQLAAWMAACGTFARRAKREALELPRRTSHLLPPTSRTKYHSVSHRRASGISSGFFSSLFLSSLLWFFSSIPSSHRPVLSGHHHRRLLTTFTSLLDLSQSFLTLRCRTTRLPSTVLSQVLLNHRLRSRTSDISHLSTFAFRRTVFAVVYRFSSLRSRSYRSSRTRSQLSARYQKLSVFVPLCNLGFLDHISSFCIFDRLPRSSNFKIASLFLATTI